MNLEQAETRLEAAQAAMVTAQAEQRKALAAQRTLEADKLLKQASRAVWRLNHDTEWPEATKALERQITAVRNVLAIEYLGAGPRLEALRRLDADRWSEGDAYYYPDDESMYYAVATYIFDSTGFRGSPHEDYYPDEQKELCSRLTDLKVKLVAALGEDAAEASIACWRDGRHDT